MVGQDKKILETGRAQTLIASNLQISKQVTLTRSTPIENIISKLKKLPDITFNIVKPKPVFKVHIIPKRKKSYTKNIITPDNKSKSVFEKKIILEKQDDNIIDKNRVITRTVHHNNTHSNLNNTSKKKKNSINKNIPRIKKNADQIIRKNLQKSLPSKYSFSEKKNEQRVLNKFPKNDRSKNKSAISKTIKPAEQVSNSSIALPGVLNSDSFVNSSKIKVDEMLALKSVNEDYTLMDLSTTGQVNVVSASRPDYIDDSMFNKVQ